MKVLQVNAYESSGKRFNGITLAPLLESHGISSRHLIWNRDTMDERVLSFDYPGARRVNELYRRVEQQLSFQSVFYGNGQHLLTMKEFEEADLLHMHLVLNEYMSLLDFPEITRRKPTVWTLHDPWPFSGHCIYPFACENWRTQCHNCPSLETPLAVAQDTTRVMFQYKMHVYKRSRFEVIVASKWMKRMAMASPLFEGIRVHEVPFGLDLDFFSPDAAPNARAQFGIPDDMVVVGFRGSHHDFFKGLAYIEHALQNIETSAKVCLLITAGNAMAERFSDRFKVIELGWVNDEKLLRDSYVATDIFLMPSLAEAFGVMAIEAMACGRPIIVFDGTALPEITFAPNVGIAVPMRDGEALRAALESLIDSPEERARRGALGRRLALQHYDERRQARQIADVYTQVVEARCPTPEIALA